MISPNHQVDIKTAFSAQIQSSFASLMPYGKPKNIKKGTFIVEENEQCQTFFFVQSGIFRTFRVTQDVEYTTGFSFKGDFDTSPFSFFYQTSATETIESITDAKIIEFERIDLLEASKNDTTLQNGINLLLAGYIEILENRLHQLRSKIAEERYLQLINAQPDDIKKIPLGYIASFLGISKERLSRIRKKLTYLT